MNAGVVTNVFLVVTNLVCAALVATHGYPQIAAFNLFAAGFFTFAAIKCLDRY